jgi:hypothetical protein
MVTDPSKEGTQYENTPMAADRIHEELLSTFTEFEPEVQVLLRVRIRFYCFSCQNVITYHAFMTPIES